MNLDEKIVHLQEAAMNEARTKANKIASQHKDALEELFKEHIVDAKRQSQMRIKSESLRAKTRLNKAVADVQTNIKREEGICQNDLKEKLFDEVFELLNEYIKSDKYEEFLIRCIEKSLSYAKEGDITIFINKTDEALKEKLEKEMGVTLTLSEIDFLGGTRAIIKKRNILIDNSFKTALEEEKRNFLFTGGDYSE